MPLRHFLRFDFSYTIQSASGRIRTYVATRALDLQSSAFDRSATDALHHHIPYN